MIHDGHYATPEIKEILTRVNEQWERLDEKAKDKGKKLREASQQELFYRTLEDANAKLSEMEKLVSSDDVGHDLRSVRTLLNKHQVGTVLVVDLFNCHKKCAKYTLIRIITEITLNISILL